LQLLIVITEITIKGAKLIAEQPGETTNLFVLMANVKQYPQMLRHW